MRKEHTMSKVIVSYLQSLLATTLTAALAIGKSPFDFTSADAKTIINSVWVAFIPVIIRALSKNDTAFGINSDSRSDAVVSD
jgi:hypothetical protein